MTSTHTAEEIKLLHALEFYITNPTVDLDNCDNETYTIEIMRLIGTRFTVEQVELLTLTKIPIIELNNTNDAVRALSKTIDGMNVYHSTYFNFYKFCWRKNNVIHREDGPAFFSIATNEPIDSEKRINISDYSLNGSKVTPIEYARYLRDKGVLKIDFDYYAYN